MIAMLWACGGQSGSTLGAPLPPLATPPPCEVGARVALGEVWSAAAWTPSGWVVGGEGTLALLDGDLRTRTEVHLAGSVQDLAWTGDTLVGATSAGLRAWRVEGGDLVDAGLLASGHFVGVAVAGRGVVALERSALWLSGARRAVAGSPFDTDGVWIAAGYGGIQDLDGELHPGWHAWATRPGDDIATGLPERSVRHVATDVDGVVWAATTARVLRCDDTDCAEATIAAGILGLVAVDGEARVLTSRGLARWSGRGSPVTVAELSASPRRLALHDTSALIVAGEELLLLDRDGDVLARRRGPEGAGAVAWGGELGWLTSSGLATTHGEVALPELTSLAGRPGGGWLVGGHHGLWSIDVDLGAVVLDERPVWGLAVRGDAAWWADAHGAWWRHDLATGTTEGPVQPVLAAPVVAVTAAGPIGLDPEFGRWVDATGVRGQAPSPVDTLRARGDLVLLPMPGLGLGFWTGGGPVEVARFWPGAHDAVGDRDAWWAARGALGLRDHTGHTCSLTGSVTWVLETQQGDVWAGGPAWAHAVPRHAPR